ncbi:MAG: hypothetical protein ACLFQK_01885 [Fibrobacterota bacterium]
MAAARRKKNGFPLFKVLIVCSAVIAAVFLYRNFEIDIDVKEKAQEEKISESRREEKKDGSAIKAREDAAGKQLKTEKKTDPRKRFYPSGSSSIDVGLGITGSSGDKSLKKRKRTFRVEKDKNLQKIHVLASIKEKDDRTVFFRFSSSGEDHDSKTYETVHNPEGYALWTWKNLAAGRWKVSVIDAATGKSLAEKRFIIHPSR